MNPEQVAKVERNTLQSVMEILQESGGRTSPIPQLEEEIYRLRDNQRLYTIKRVDNHNAKAKFYNSPPDSIPGKIDYFLDTHQRTQLIGHFLTPLGFQVPVHYSMIMCLILERKDRRFKVWSEPILQHLVLLPFAFLNGKAKFEKTRGEVRIVDTGIGDPDYTQIRVQSVQIAYRELNNIKLGLLKEWREKTKGTNSYIIHNGSSLEDPNEMLDPRVIGWSKTVYLPFKGAKEADIKHLELASFQRSPVFKLFREDEQGQGTTKYGWFIKLREHTRHGPEFGLIKPHIIAKSEGEAVAAAEWLSYLLLLERQPATFPAAGWDKLIFPIKLCRTYLDGIVPTHETIRSFFDRT